MARLRFVAVNVAVLAALLIVIEGAAGFGSVVRGYLTSPEMAERRHTRYDPLLGWVNLPAVNIPDMYGPGVSFRTNGQGFRNNADFERAVPPGRIRIICSGDSFALGYGVDNDRTWCELLSSRDRRLETVNMGQGGYGVDQAYLWYTRDGLALDHHIQIFAFITEDFSRAAASAFMGYGKPVLAIEHGALTVTNVPVPGPANPRLRRGLEQVRRLRTAGALYWALGVVGLERAGRPDLSPDETQVVVAKLLADLKRIHDEQSTTLILVRLPVDDRLAKPDAYWMPFVRRQSEALGIPLIDLKDDFGRLPAATMTGMYIQEGELDYPGSAGHYTSAGNEFVARMIYEGLKDHLTVE